MASLPSQGMGAFGTALLFGIGGGEISPGLNWAPSVPWSFPCFRSHEENSPSMGEGSTHCWCWIVTFCGGSVPPTQPGQGCWHSGGPGGETQGQGQLWARQGWDRAQEGH